MLEESILQLDSRPTVASQTRVSAGLFFWLARPLMSRKIISINKNQISEKTTRSLSPVFDPIGLPFGAATC